MKAEVKKLLKERGEPDLFTEKRYWQVVEVMKHGMTKDLWLKNYLSLDPLNKVNWIADHIKKFVTEGHIQ